MDQVDLALLEQALRAHQTLPLRAESHKSFSALFVDERQLSLLDTADWQVIYGRRGTGKTVYLKTREEHLLAAPAVTRSLPLYLSMQDAIASPPVGLAASDRQRAYGTFQLFLERLADEIAAKAPSILSELSSGKDNILIRSLVGRSKRPTPNVAKVDAIIRDLLTFMQSGDLIAAFSDASVAEVETERRTRQRSVGGRAGGAATPAGIGAGVELHGEASRGQSIDDERVRKSGGRNVPRFPNLRRALTELLEALELDRLEILIDEWSVLDPTGTTEIQPRFAALLRRALFGDERITVKIAANRYNTVFQRQEPHARYGIEPNADIFEAVNLDRALIKRSNLADFYEELLFKRLLLKTPALARYAGTRGRPGAGFAEMFFESSEVFTELVSGCEGVPRDFIITFRYLAQWSEYSVSPRWSRAAVHDAFMELSMSTIDQMVYGSPATSLLEGGIKETALRTGSRLVLIRRAGFDRLEGVVTLLLEQRLIHEYVGTDLPVGVRKAFYPYLVAYGLWWDWERSRQHAGTEASVDAPTLTTPEQIARHTVETDT